MTFIELFNADVAIEKDVRYREGDNPRHTLDIYAPPDAEGLPVVVWFYGGGWRSGDKRLFEHLGRAFAVRGIVTVTVNYRLTPEVTWPENGEDCAAAVGWAYRNIGTYGGDPSRLFLVGHSAGAHLAAMITLNRSFLKDADVPESAVQGCVMISGATDLPGHVGSTRFTSREHVEETFGSSTEELAEASPRTWVRDDAPPFLIMVAERDPEGLREQGKELSDDLREAGATVRYLIVNNHDHFSIVRRFGPSDDVTANAITEFIRRIEN